METTENIYLYMEDPPYIDGTPSTGLSRVNLHILKAFGVQANTVIVRTLPFATKNKYIDSQGLKTISVGGVNLFIGKVMKKLSERFPENLGICPASTFALRPLKAKSNAVLFAPVGTDLGAILRAHKVSNYLNAELVLFLVDDLFDNLRHDSSLSKLIDKVGKIIGETRILFCATEGLALVYGRFNRNAVALPMPFEPRVRIENSQYSPSNEIIFLGNPSHFYKEGIEELVKILPRFQNTGVTFRCTFGKEYLSELASRTGSKIVVEPYRHEIELAHALSNCLFAFAPYSFSEEFRNMTETSFPSKLFEYLAYSHSICVWAPERSSAACFFKRNALPGLITDRSPEAIIGFIDNQLQCGIDNGPLYRGAVQHFSYQSFRTIFNGAINEIN